MFDTEFRLVLSSELREATTNAVPDSSVLAFAGAALRLPEEFRPGVPSCWTEFLERHPTYVFCG